MLLLKLISLLSTIVLIHGHGRLMHPPGRGSAWRFGFKTPTNYNDEGLYCGGYSVCSIYFFFFFCLRTEWTHNTFECKKFRPNGTTMASAAFAAMVGPFRHREITNCSVDSWPNHRQLLTTTRQVRRSSSKCNWRPTTADFLFFKFVRPTIALKWPNSVCKAIRWCCRLTATFQNRKWLSTECPCWTTATSPTIG